jgi:hypothetical protein
MTSRTFVQAFLQRNSGAKGVLLAGLYEEHRHRNAVGTFLSLLLTNRVWCRIFLESRLSFRTKSKWVARWLSKHTKKEEIAGVIDNFSFLDDFPHHRLINLPLSKYALLAKSEQELLWVLLKADESENLPWLRKTADSFFKMKPSACSLKKLCVSESSYNVRAWEMLRALDAKSPGLLSPQLLQSLLCDIEGESDLGEMILQEYLNKACDDEI